MEIHPLSPFLYERKGEEKEGGAYAPLRHPAKEVGESPFIYRGCSSNQLNK
jgi:hypothetical protein